MNTFAKQRNKLRIWLTLILVALAIPTVALLIRSFNQLQYEAFYLQRSLAESFAGQVQRQFDEWFIAEAARPTTDYDFLVISGETYVQRSPLSSLTPATNVPGVVGFFQVDATGDFTTPLLPGKGLGRDDGKLSADEYAARTAMQDTIRALLEASTTDSDAAPAAPAQLADDSGEARKADMQEESKVAGDRASAAASGRSRQIFDQLSRLDQGIETAELDAELPKVADLKLKEKFASTPPPAEPAPSSPVRSIAPQRVPQAELAKRQVKRQERAVIAQSAGDEAPDDRQITTFDSAVDPFRMERLDRSHWVVFRNVWTQNERYVQGFIVAIDAFLGRLIGDAYAASQLAATTDLLVAAEGNVIELFSAKPAYGASSALDGDLLLRHRLPDPGGQFELVFSATTLPYGPGTATLAWIGTILILVIGVGFWWIYRLGVRQIALAEQQQDFVSAVSHELKTPLTSIRMYGEILRAGWADEAKRKTYYEHIFQESERLSRLINNVLYLARIKRNHQDPFALQPIRVQDLLANCTASIANASAQAGFTLQQEYDEGIDQILVEANADAFSQVMINLTDNALKFGGDDRRIQVGARQRGDCIEFRVRDFGPGIARDQLKKIFRMFYRVENEMTRETSGTGIGLALVSELVSLMDGQVDVVNCDPGAEFRVRLRIADA